ncbi:MAG: hypothetical protein A2626_00835 [Candidatus Nealsonbacteria bacterium RIFCSPHIGHO2_01_FULL_38_55]|uniref:RRM domain-containing protein n=2 Tax=Candidatus Nealsoniibacteriota TaxID=1817911 RepID=A0A1G2EJ65_9BACT|nr:MAG: hypothetical protein A2626_00835 [Candidatus Nealsonbacteria bacterium RIFCSPHIGHO2_01_FULL_38_55]OGZ25807.1 MAG: hypothetical protein A2W71_00385 [Candidatus Nealsonbacteria bacterium RIFCSPLOWO2_02_39_8]OGZ26462.1 MAG: hypothetical protein A3I85_01000 [Candidatus Nealsonbacteria bacterium RIFCSPLOWO2_02_FULL_38_63]
MKRKPTLGGLKKVQEFLKSKGHAMPIVQMGIYDDYQLVGGPATLRREPGKGKNVSLNELINALSPMHRVINVRLANEYGGAFIEFSERRNATSALELMGSAGEGQDKVVVEYSAALRELFISDDVMELAQWGKVAPSLFERFIFYASPSLYAKKVFAYP